ncbi:MAG TPA: FHA domain-containing protein, partial [Pyrinomonadaceae bacterium]|nr:FHA domain-containing protein [Pyrinomonadaceae bacterium]
MSSAKLLINESEFEPRDFELPSGVITLGRAPDNKISFSSDSNISRYHAEIERRGDNFYLIDLGSRNGTSINGEAVSGERRLQNGDRINLGGSDIEIEFKLNEAKEPQTELFSNEPDFDFVAPNVALPQAEAPLAAVEAVPGASKIPIVLAAAAVLSGLAIVAVVAAVLFWRAEAACEPEATILSPESGATISEATEIKVAAKNTKCIERVAFELDGEEIASAATAPYSVTLEPENFRQFADDETSHVLSLKIVNRDGIA